MYVTIYATLVVLSTVAGIWITTSVDPLDMFPAAIMVSVGQGVLFLVVSDRIGDYDWDHRDA